MGNRSCLARVLEPNELEESMAGVTSVDLGELEKQHEEYKQEQRKIGNKVTRSDDSITSEKVLEIRILASRYQRKKEQDTIVLCIPNEKLLGVIDCYDAQYAIDCLDAVRNRYNIETKELDFVVATHNHYDHIDGMVQLLTEYPPNQYMFSNSEYRDVHDSDGNLVPEPLIEFLQDYNVIEVNSETLPYSFGDAKLHFLAPIRGGFPNTGNINHDFNNSSIVIRLEYGASKVLLAGDSQYTSWDYMCQESRKYPTKTLKSHVLKVPHHGRYNQNITEHAENPSGCWAFLKLVSPDFAIITANKSTYSHAGNQIKQYFPEITLLHTYLSKSVRNNILISCSHELPKGNYPIIITELGNDFVM
ncbi:MAG: ComEC/Rec2 family competence protein [Candidatus Thorarchaeota archaeon]